MRHLVFLTGGLAGFVLAVALRMVIGGASSADAQLVTAAPDLPPVASAALGAALPAKAAAAQPANATSHFAIDPAQSTTKILVTQTGLLGDSTLVANGSNVTGDVFLTSTGALGQPASGLQMDLRTLRSSDSALSSFIKSDLGAAQDPMAVFAIESLSGIPANYNDGNEFTFTMTGPLTMHGQSHTVAWTAKGRQSGEFLTFAADTDFLMTDYGWTPPNYGVARAKNSVHLQVVVLAKIAP